MTDKLKEALEHFGWLRDNGYLTEEATLHVGKLEQAQAQNARLVEAAHCMLDTEIGVTCGIGEYRCFDGDVIDAFRAAIAEHEASVGREGGHE